MSLILYDYTFVRNGSCANARDKIAHDKTVLQLCIEKKDTSITEILLEQGADPFLNDHLGQNSLHTILYSAIPLPKILEYLNKYLFS